VRRRGSQKLQWSGAGTELQFCDRRLNIPTEKTMAALIFNFASKFFFQNGRSVAPVLYILEKNHRTKISDSVEFSLRLDRG